MKPKIMPKPDHSEYPPFYNGYVNHVPNADLKDLLSAQHHRTVAYFGGLSDAQAEYAYAPGKWSLKEVLGHISDAERVFSYRGLCMARGDQQSLPGMDQDAYMVHANFAGRSIKSLIDEYDSIRQATLHFLTHLSPDDLQKTGVANNGHFTVNAIMHIIAGHELHHMAIIQERYS